MLNFQHPVRVDAKTQAIFKHSNAITPNGVGPNGSYFLSFAPAVFLHAYTLLGNSPQRFGQDLSLYLSTANTFFDRGATSLVGHVSLVGINISDAKKRLAEDLGVALSALFMVEAFGVGWDTIAQIPQNSQLSKKRPDFEGFDGRNDRHLFEAKGTTVLGSVESALHKAIEQVKKYPEAANSKLAIVTYLASDDRLFPSQTFVVDPPAMPDSVPPTRDVALLLHGGKVFQFAGLPETAAAYIRALAKFLRSEMTTSDVVAYAPRDATLYATFTEEMDRANLTERVVGNSTFVGRRIEMKDLGRSIFFGVKRTHLDALTQMSSIEDSSGNSTDTLEQFVSIFPDGSCLLIDSN